VTCPHFSPGHRDATSAIAVLALDFLILYGLLTQQLRVHAITAVTGTPGEPGEGTVMAAAESQGSHGR
jgi:hypothetical protein